MEKIRNQNTEFHFEWRHDFAYSIQLLVLEMHVFDTTPAYSPKNERGTVTSKNLHVMLPYSIFAIHVLKPIWIANFGLINSSHLNPQYLEGERESEIQRKRAMLTVVDSRFSLFSIPLALYSMRCFDTMMLCAEKLLLPTTNNVSNKPRRLTKTEHKQILATTSKNEQTES